MKKLLLILLIAGIMFPMVANADEINSVISKTITEQIRQLTLQVERLKKELASMQTATSTQYVSTPTIVIAPPVMTTGVISQTETPKIVFKLIPVWSCALSPQSPRCISGWQFCQNMKPSEPRQIVRDMCAEFNQVVR